MANIYFLCAAESEGEKNNVFGMDYPLTDRGVIQAERMVKFFETIPCVIVSSTCLRGLMTARTIFKNRNGFITDKRFNEINFGIMEGLPMTDFAKNRIINNLNRLNEEVKGDDVETRVRDALTALHSCAISTNDNVVLVSHDALMECMLMKIGFTNDKIEQDGGFKFWGNGKILNCHAVMLDKDVFCKAVRILYK